MALFQHRICYGHEICISPGMFETLHHGDSSGGEPTPKFASDAEIALAAQLRQQLEVRYLAASAVPSSSKKPPVEMH